MANVEEPVMFLAMADLNSDRPVVRIIFSPEAEADLESIGDYIALDNPSRALSFTQQMRAACTELAEHPRRFERLDRSR